MEANKDDAMFSAEAYLVLDRQSEVRLELVDGQVAARGGESLRHNLIAWNIGATLRHQLAERERLRMRV